MGSWVPAESSWANPELNFSFKFDAKVDMGSRL